MVADQVDHGHRGDRLGERQPLPLLRQPSLAVAGKEERAISTRNSSFYVLVPIIFPREIAEAVGVIIVNHVVEAVTSS